MAKQDFWKKELSGEHKIKHLSKKQVKTAKAHARAAGRPYPNLVDNAAVARAAKSKGR